MLGGGRLIETLRSEGESQRAAARAKSQNRALNRIHSVHKGQVLHSNIESEDRFDNLNLQPILGRLDRIDRAIEYLARRDEIETPAASTQVTPARPQLGEDGVHIDPLKETFEFIPLRDPGLRLEIPVSGKRAVDIGITVASQATEKDERASLVAVTAKRRDGTQSTFPLTESLSPKFGYFKYLPVRGSETENIVRVVLPLDAEILEVSIHPWATTVAVKNFVSLNFEDRLQGNKHRLSDLRVAAILDEFSFNSFKAECDLVAVTPQGWRESFRLHAPQLFLCESAWSGHDSETRPWKGKIYSSENFSHENRKDLLEILDYCRKAGIPTIFWNKEDPSHFDDTVHNFVDTAIKFDHVFSTDIESVKRYRDEYGHPSAHLLQFAVQPKLFNPIETGPRSNEVVFAGGWYENHIQRSKDMAQIFDSVMESGRSVKIYDRFFNFTDDDTHIFPERFRRFTVPPVSGEQMPDVYKESIYGITINTETRSSTMFARRIYEMMACNTLVISNYSRGVDKSFGQSVLFLDKYPGALQNIDSEWIASARLKNLETVLQHHTYEERLKSIVDVVGIDVELNSALTTAVIVVNDSRQIRHAFEALRSLNSAVFGMRVIAVGSSITPLSFAATLREFNRDGVQVVQQRNLFEQWFTKTVQPGPVFYLRDPELEDYAEIGDLQSRFSLHASYTDSPMSVSRTMHDNFRFKYSAPVGPVFFPAERWDEVMPQLINSRYLEHLPIQMG